MSLDQQRSSSFPATSDTQFGIFRHTLIPTQEENNYGNDCRNQGQQPSADLPDQIVQDFDEARSILNYSPRGAAALLRLSVQKLCAFLGVKGKKIDEDIASHVAKGLNPLVQKSLDVVRVIGNEAVHPGTIDLKDDRETALRLLELVNIIAEQMISHLKNDM